MTGGREISDETKEKIRGKLRDRWATKKQVRGYQDMLTKEWKNCVAEAARMGGLGEEELQWNSYTILKKKLRLAAAAQTRLEKKEAKAKLEATRPLKSKEHRLRISAAIRAKWEDPVRSVLKLSLTPVRLELPYQFS